MKLNIDNGPSSEGWEERKRQIKGHNRFIEATRGPSLFDTISYVVLALALLIWFIILSGKPAIEQNSNKHGGQ